jgi:hypothetical protein
VLTLADDHLKNQKNKNMAANLDNGVILGALGSVYSNNTEAVTPPSGMVIAAIQFISGGASGSKITALVAEEPDRFFNTINASHQSTGTSSFYTHNTQDHGGGGDTLPNNVSYPAGMTLYGRWTSATFSADSTGGVICYFGY